MKTRRIAAVVAAAALAGVVIGTASMGFAAPAGSPSGSGVAGVTSSWCTGTGLRLGTAVAEAGGRLADVLADLTGQTVAGVIAERQSGKTYAEIAQAYGVDPSAVVERALAIRAQLLTEQVAAGAITQAQADAALEQMRTRIEAQMTATGTRCLGTGTGAGGACMRGSGMGYGSGAGWGGQTGTRGSGQCRRSW